MKIFYMILLVVIVVIVIDFLILSHNTGYDKPRMDNMKILEGFSHPHFFVDFPSPHDRILSYNESLYGGFAR